LDNAQHTRIGIDIGGTFTDFVIYDPATQALQSFKLSSTPADPAQAVLTGLQSKLITGTALRIIHGSTVATNALLERKGAPTALVTTRGFRDVLQIGRQNRASLYDLRASPPAPLVPRNWRLEVNERVDHHGNVQVALDPDEMDTLIPFLQQQGVQSVAVCLLYSFLHPVHEQQIADRLRRAGMFVSASSEILPEYREYERTSTTVVNAYVTPILDRYIAHLEQALRGEDQPRRAVDIRIMQSNGGSIRTQEARRAGVRCIVSGPAGGVVGALHMARLAAQPANHPAKIITFDMGGTSTDVSLCVDAIQTTSEATIGGFPIRIPIIDIHTVGAGGGSIANPDPGGALRVGPQSAGADPGPACYGHSDQPTVTDANVILGRLPVDHFLGGQMKLDSKRARHALEALGKPLGLNAIEAARGVVEIVNAHMELALRVISVERGHDPRDFTLMSFGGAGGLHAVELARRLAIPTVLVSPFASTLSEFGMLVADVVKDYAQTVMLSGDTPFRTMEPLLSALSERGLREVVDEGVAQQDVFIQPLLDMRYRGQSYELSIPFTPGFISDFHSAHQVAYGYARTESQVEIVNLRLRVIGRVPPPPLKPHPIEGPDPSAALIERRRVTLDTLEQVPFYQGALLRPGNQISGPAIIIRNDTTVLLGARDQARIDGYLNLIVRVGAG
jgi:N-methylhydantoinase A